MAVARKAAALIEAGWEGGERLRLHRVPLEAFSTVYSFYTVLAGYEGDKWELLSTKEAEDQVLSLQDGDGTIMHWAACDNSTAKLATVIAARDPGLLHSRDDIGCTPLHMAVLMYCEVVARALLEAGADQHAKNTNGETPLQRAQKNGYKDLVAMMS